jgi:hypothetical protein
MGRLGLVALVSAVLVLAVGIGSASAAAPEWGRCVRVAKATGAYSTGTCTVAGSGSYEWLPGPGPDPRFTLTVKAEERFPFAAQGRVGTREACREATTTGEITGPGSVGNFTPFVWEGCEFSAFNCERGETDAEIGEGILGVWKTGGTAMTDRIGLELTPLEFTCSRAPAPLSMQGEGDVIGQLGSVASMSLAKTLTLAGRKSKGLYVAQVPDKFEGGPELSLEWNPESAAPPFEQAVIVWKSTLTFAEKIEINPVI